MADVAVLQVGGTYYSSQGGIHINNKDSGMHDLRSVQISFLIDGPMKDLISCVWELLLERFMTLPNATLRQIVTLVRARPFSGLF